MKPPRSAPQPSRAPVAAPWAPLTPALPGFSTPATLPGLAGHGQASVMALRQAFSAPEPLEEKGARTQRRRLWQLPPKFHCPVVGVCFTVEELRPWVVKMLSLPPASSDYELHVGAVGACASRTPFAEALQRRLEKRYATQIRRFAQARGRAGVLALWRDAVHSGLEIPGAMWAAWTHPGCDESLEQDIFRDIHMIQHQVGTGARADLKTLQALRTENAELRRQVDVLRQDAEAARHEKAGETRALGERLTELRAEQAGRDACIARLSAELERLRDSVPELRQRQALARRAEDADARATALAAQCREQAETVERLQRRLAELAPADNRQAEDTSLPGSTDETLRTAACESLDGKCVLCVGGRSGAVGAYREAVERQGGRFLHHDGGLEESLHRIDSALAAADLVICQAGCISHNAYWRVKEQCKRTGKPCLFVKRSGVSSFGRVIADLCGEEPEAVSTD